MIVELMIVKPIFKIMIVKLIFDLLYNKYLLKLIYSFNYNKNKKACYFTLLAKLFIRTNKSCKLLIIRQSIK